MSEHIQPAPGSHGVPHAAPAAPPHAATEERTPGVSHERDMFSMRLILWCGFGLIVTAVVIHLVTWWLMRGLEQYNAEPSGTVSELALEDAQRPLEQRISNTPTPHLEGIDRPSTLLILRTESGKNERFYVDRSAHIQIDKKKDASLIDLRLGQHVTITYHMPGGVASALGVVSAVRSPPGEAEKKSTGPERPDVSRTLNGEIMRLTPQDIALAREWAEVQSKRYGWIDRNKGIVHIPIEMAMEEAVKTKEFGDRGDKGDGRIPLPTRSSSGRTTRGSYR